MKRLIISAALATLLASPVFAQSYSATYGTGNTINLPQAEATNGAAGVGVQAYNGAHGAYGAAPSAFAYAPRRGYSSPMWYHEMR